MITVTWKPYLRTENGERLVARAGDSRPRVGSSPSSAIRFGLGTLCASIFLICEPQNSLPPRLGFKGTVFIILRPGGLRKAHIRGSGRAAAVGFITGTNGNSLTGPGKHLWETSSQLHIA